MTEQLNKITSMPMRQLRTMAFFMVAALGFLTATAQAQAWTELKYDEFETGFGNYTDGGGDCRLSTIFAIGTQCLHLRDDSTSSEAVLTEPLDLTSYSEVKIEFSYTVVSFENTEDFWVRYSSDGGATWSTLKTFVNDVDFVDDGTRYNPVITISSTNHTFSNNAKIMLKCDANRNNDNLYIDNLRISARMPASINIAPIAVNDTGISVAEDHSGLNIDVLANDSDADPLTIKGTTDGAKGNVVVNGSHVSYTPALNETGADSFTYTVSDGSLFATGMVSLTIIAQNDPPLFGSTYYSLMDANETAIYTGSIGDYASDVDTGDTLTYSKISGAAWLLIASDGTLSGTPTIGDAGLNSFSVEVSDGSTVDSATLEITVISVAPSNLPYGNWSHGTSNRVMNVAAAQLAGYYASSDRTANAIEIRDIQKNLLGSINASDILAVMPWADLTGDGYGPCGLAFTASGRQLFVAVIGSPSSTNGNNPKDAILAYNLNLDELRLFKQLDLATDLGSNDVGCGLAHFNGELFVGTRNNTVLRYQAQMNDITGILLETINMNGMGGVSGLAVDMFDNKLYASTESRLNRVDLATTNAVAEEILSCYLTKSITFGRTFGAAGDEGLYILRKNGDIRRIALTDLRAGGSVPSDPIYESTGTENSIDIAATPCGRMLLASDNVYLIEDTDDTRLSYGDWLQDEYDQYIMGTKALCWPNGEASGWIYPAMADAGQSISAYSNPGAGGWAILMLMLHEARTGDTEAQPLIREILKRYAGLHADGIVPTTNADGWTFSRYNTSTGVGTPHGNGTYASGYTTAKLYRAAMLAARRYPNDLDIQQAYVVLLGRINNWSDYVFGNGSTAQISENISGPGYHGLSNPNGEPPFNEIYLMGELAGAADSMASYASQEFWMNRDRWPGDYYLTSEPVARDNVSAFVVQYGHIVFSQWRNDPAWRNEFANHYASYSAWTDDNAAHYLTVPSAGTTDTIGYNADDLLDNPDRITHFPAMLGCGIYGDSEPMVAAYFAYRDGIRQQMKETSTMPGPQLLTRYSNNNPAWMPGSLALPDYHFGFFGLAEHLSPGIIDQVIASRAYLPPQATVDTNGNTRVEFSELIPRRILARMDAESKWDSFGFQMTPFIFPAGTPYTEFSVNDPEGEFIAIPNADCKQGLVGWTSVGDYQFYPSAGVAGIIGTSAEIRTTINSASPESYLYQTLDVSAEIDQTRFIVRGIGYSIFPDPDGAAFLRVVWDNDSDIHNGGISTSESNILDTSDERVEYRIDTEKPAGANYMHLCLVAQIGVPEYERYLFGNLSMVRLGSLIAFSNGGFELGNFSGWNRWNTGYQNITTQSGEVMEGASAVKFTFAPSVANNTSSTLQHNYDISGDPIGTRYIVRVKVASQNLEGSHLHLKVRMDDDTNNSSYLLEEYDDSLYLGYQLREMYINIRKTDAAQNYLRPFILMKRMDRSAVTAEEVIIVDDIRVSKEIL